MTCAICRRMARGFGYRDKIFDSMTCLDIYSWKDKNMADFNADEEQAMLKGGAAGAEYLASIGQFSLDKLTPEQALTFLKSLIGAYHEHLVAMEAIRL